jgi:hypothetical protein
MRKPRYSLHKPTLTFGAELEFADVLYGQPLPEGSAWNREDGSIVNSNGIANCPRGKLWQYGGEINTLPTNTADEQVQVFKDIIEILDPKPVINYRCNLHIHVGMRGLRNDLAALKKLLIYIHVWQYTIFQMIDPIPEPILSDYPDKSAFRGARKRYRRRGRSHQTMLTTPRMSKMLNAKTTEEFYLAHFKLSKKGKPLKHLHQRCGINLCSLWENDETIEFRHFPGTTDPEEFRTAVTWCEAFLKNAITHQLSPDHLLAITMDDPKFPTFRQYEHELEKGYQKTYYKKSTKERKKNILALARNFIEPVRV